MTALYQAIVYSALLLEICTSNLQNVRACLTNQDQWLYPSIQEGIELVTRQTIPYTTELTGDEN